MQINLRKANKLRKDIEARLADVRIDQTVVIDVDDKASRENPASIIEAARRASIEEAERLVSLSGYLARLRIRISEENVRSGVDTALAEASDIDRCIKILSRFSEARSRNESADSIAAKVKRVADQLDRPDAPHEYGGKTTTVNATLVDAGTAELFANRIANFKRMKEALEDKRLGLNASTHIEIGEDDLKLLRDMKLV